MKRLVLPLVLAVALIAGLAAALSGGLAVAAGPETFTDPAGDAGGAPDVTSVTVDDDPASGIVTVTVHAAGVHPDTSINVYFNTDLAGQADYWTHYQRGKTRWSWSTSRWDGAAWQKITQTNSMNIVPGNDTVTWTFGKWDLGITTGFRLHVKTALKAATGSTVLAGDLAPDKGRWLHRLSSAAPPTSSTPPRTSTAVTTTPVQTADIRPLIGKPTIVPTRAIAGKRLTVSFPVTRGIDGSPLPSGRMICDPSVAGKPIPHSEQLRNGTARLALTLPTYAKDKLLTVKVTIKLGTKASTRTATFRVA
ncbi:MAG TPA: hypothetical protein VIU16_01745 [Gaiellaceae bacterium]